MTAQAPNPTPKQETSIVVCTVDRLTELDACLASLQRFQAAGAEVVVVNNGPYLACVEEVAGRYQACVVTESRRGVSRARNAGVRAARGRILAFLDDDSVAAIDWLPRLLDPLRDPLVLAVVGSVQPQSLAAPATKALDELHRAQFPPSPVVLSGAGGEFPMRTALLANANMALRREVFERFGYFDTRFGRGTRIGSGEEPDLFLRILLGGGKIAAEPGARIFHHHSAEWQAVRKWAFQSGCAHTAMLTKYFLQEAQWHGTILRYVFSRARRTTAPAALSEPRTRPVSRTPLLFGSLYGPLAFLLSGVER